MEKTPQVDVPSKTFLLGEYGVLLGMPALVLAHGPRMKFAISTGTEGSSAHPDSPAGRLACELGKSIAVLDNSNRSGFGTSTAEFVAFGATTQLDWKSLWFKYRELSNIGEQGCPGIGVVQRALPSGADLVAQKLGGLVEFRIGKDGPHANCWELPRALAADLLIFGAPQQRKTATHEHLQSLDLADLQKMGLEQTVPSIDKVITRLRIRADLYTAEDESRLRQALTSAMVACSQVLHTAGLECEEAHGARYSLGEVRGVQAAKGCGALQSDALIVVMKAGHARTDRDLAIERGLSLGYRLVSDGVSVVEPGAQFGAIEQSC